MRENQNVRTSYALGVCHYERTSQQTGEYQ